MFDVAGDHGVPDGGVLLRSAGEEDVGVVELVVEEVGEGSSRR